MLHKRFWIAMVAVVLCFGAGAGRQAQAVVLASDDFNAEGGGIGFVPGDAWGNLAGGVSSTVVANPAFRAFSPELAPFDSPSIFIAFDFQINQSQNWGGVAFFEGVDGGNETLFIGDASGVTNYAMDLKRDNLDLNSGVAIDNQMHRIIAEVSFGALGDTYRLWVDNFNQSIPHAATTIEGFVIANAWQSARVASDVGAGANVQVDNLVISNSAADVGLQAGVNAVASINRATGAVTFRSNSGTLQNVVGYSLRSAAGGLDVAGWSPIDGRLDTPGGNGSFDNDNWLADAGTALLLRESVISTIPGDGATLTTTGVTLGSAWNGTPIEDVFATVTVNQSGTLVPLAVQVVYTGAEIASGDLNGDGAINLVDWNAFKSGQGAVNNGMTAVQAYQRGDLDGNFVHDLTDFGLFVAAYNGLNGAGAFAADLGAVPEPTSLALVCGAALSLGLWRMRRGAMLAVAALLAAVWMATPASAVIFAQDDFSGPGSGTGWAAGSNWNGLDGGVVATHPGGGANTPSFRNFATPIDATNSVTYFRFDYRQQEGTGAAWGGFAFFEGLNATAGESFFAGANSGNDTVNQYSFDLKNGQDLDSGIPFNNLFHTIIGSVDTTGANTTYRMWVDNYNISAPNAQVTIAGQGPIDAPWLSLRWQGGGQHEFADNLLITNAAETALIFQAPPSTELNLLVNKTTGQVTLENNTGSNVGISAYSITSASGALNSGGAPGDFNADSVVDSADYTVWRDTLGLNSAALNGNGTGGVTVTAADYDLWRANYGSTENPAAGWQSLAERGTPAGGFPQGNGSGNGWEEGGNPTDFELEEYYLTGQSTVTTTDISLGAAYGGGVNGAQDLVFVYRSGDELVFGTVQYVNGGSLAAGTVPEPATLGLCGVATVGLWLLRRRR